MGTSINTSISPSVPFSRRVINDIEENQRRVLNDSVEGTNRGINTFPVPNPGEQEEEVIFPNTGPQARIIPAEIQEETLQLESLEIQDTSLKQVTAMPDQDSKFLQAQNIGETEVPDAQDTSDTQIQDDGTDSQLNGEECNPNILAARHLKHRRKIIIVLPLTMTNRMTQYNLAIQSPNCSCQEALEYPLQR